MRASECLAVAIDVATGELALPPHFVSGIEAVRVLAWAAVRCARGEFFADTDNPADVPLSPAAAVPADRAWFGGAAPAQAEIEAQLRRTLATVPGVGSVVSLLVETLPRRERRVTAVLVTAFDDEPPTQVVLSA